MSNPDDGQRQRANGKSVELAQRRGEYGVDAPYVPLMLGTGGAVLLAIAALSPGSGALHRCTQASGYC